MKRFIAALMCIIMVFTLTACGAENEGGNSVAVKHNAPEIDEFGIYISEADFISTLNSFGVECQEAILSSQYYIAGNEDNTITFYKDNDDISFISLTISDVTENKAATVKYSTDIFKSIIMILYPDTNEDELDDTLKEIRYEEEQNELSPKSHFYNDVYLTYYTTFGPKGLTLTDESVTQAHWKVETISSYNK